jgi:hypothetical protein
MRAEFMDPTPKEVTVPPGVPFNPAAASKPLGGQALLNAGFGVTRWIPQTARFDETLRGVFDPTSINPAQRYGNPTGLAVKGWPPSQLATTHAAEFDNQFAPRLMPLVLGSLSDLQQDTTDLCFVMGATQYILRTARAMAKAGDTQILNLMAELGMEVEPTAAPPPPPPPPPPDPDPDPAPLPSDFEQRLQDVEGLILHHGTVLKDQGAGLLAGRTRLERVEKSLLDHSLKSTEDYLSLLARVNALEQAAKPGPGPVVPPPPPSPPPPPQGKEVFRAPDFVVGIGGANGAVARFTDAARVMRCSWDPAKDRYRSLTLEFDLEIPRHHFTGIKGQKENLYWVARTNNRDLIGYALLTQDNLVAVEGMGMVHGEKERKTTKGLDPGKYHIFYEWTEGANWRLHVESNNQVRLIDGSATGQLDFSRGRKLLADFGYPDPNSPEIPTPGWAYSGITLTLSE